MTGAVEIRGLRVVRGGQEVLHGVSLDVEPGRVTGLLGPSGSGKTTLIRSVVGVQIVAAGDVTVLGLPAGSRELRARIGYMTQEPAVYRDLTVRENLAYFGRILGVGAGRVDELVERVGLVDERDRVVGTLSGGQRARVSLATGLLNGPDLLVLDEPTVGLDPVLRRDLWQAFARLADEGATLLVSSHVMDEAERCDELLLLHQGRLLARGTTGELLARTGAEGMDEAFLRLIDSGDEA